LGTRGSHLSVGTEQWLRATGGRLTLFQALRISAQGFAQTIHARVTGRSRLSDAEASSQFARVSAARKVLSLVLSSLQNHVLDRQGQEVLNHACRTYLLGAALMPDEVFHRLDHTVAAVAALSHDDGLLHPSTLGNCFTADSAIETNNMMASLGLPESSSLQARAAVISHFQPKLPVNSGAEAQLVALGASADVMGIGLTKIHPQLIREIWQEWPDLGFLTLIKKLLKREKSRAPRTRAGVLALSGMPYLLRKSRA
jgi:hypothetical protein